VDPYNNDRSFIDNHKNVHLIIELMGYQVTDSETTEFVLDASVELRSAVRQIAINLPDPGPKGEILKACDSFRKQLKSVNINLKDNINQSSWSRE